MPQKTLVLIGCGHANIQVLHAISGFDVKVVLISDVEFSPYSGMLPGYLAGDYREDELVFGLESICKRFNYQLIHQVVQSVDPIKNEIFLSDGQIIKFDLCSINVGILPAPIGGFDDNTNVIYVKPISRFLTKWKSATSSPEMNRNVVVIGGGAAAFELAVACSLTLSKNVTMIAGSPQLTLPIGAHHRARLSLIKRGIQLIEGSRVTKITNNKIILLNREQPFDLCLVATSASPPPILSKSDLPLDSRGYLLTDERLCVEGFSHIFAAGDCISFAGEVLPKSGVYAVRQGTVLAHNILCKLKNKKRLKKYRPQKSVLSILVSGKQEAILCWKGFAIEGHWAWRLKRFIDKKFMQRFS